MLDPDRDPARELLRTELAHPEYNRPESFVVRAVNWLFERLGRVIDVLPGSQGLSVLLLVIVLVLVGLAIFFAVRGTRRSGRLTDRATGPVLAETGLTAADYRARAERAARAGDWDAVLLDSYRAIAAGTDERTLLDDAPGTTAHEIAVGLRQPFPQHSEPLLAAADAFDAVCYGDEHATREQAEQVRDLDRTLDRTKPAKAVFA